MIDLPDDPEQLTPKAARQAEAGPETGRLVLRCMGWQPELRHKPGYSGNDKQAAWVKGDDVRFVGFCPLERIPVIKSWGHQTSRTAKGAYRAREWIRDNYTPTGEWKYGKWSTDNSVDDERIALDLADCYDLIDVRVGEHLAVVCGRRTEVVEEIGRAPGVWDELYALPGVGMTDYDPPGCEHLHSARLLLCMIAEGYIEPGGEP